MIPETPSYLLQFPNSRSVPFEEVLSTYNGFKPGQGWIDLWPLMELRIENAYYQKGASRRGLAGFLGTEVALYEIRSRGLRLLSMQPMANRLADELSAAQLISEAKEHFRFYRLYYEIVFRGAGGSHGSVLLGANSRAELIQLSNELDRPETVCNAASVHCTVFPEACSVSVEMKITVNGKAQMVVWGSPLESIADHPHRLSMRRLYRGHLTPVKIDAADTKVLRLPLLPGDDVSWE